MTTPNIIKKCLSVIALFIAATTTACSSLTVREKDSAAVAQIERVAVIGFENVQPMATLSGVTKLVEKGGDAFDRVDPHADQMYEDLVAALKAQMNWQIVDRQKMVSNGTYQRLFHKTMTGLQQTQMPVGPDQTKTLAKDIMEADCGRRMEIAGRDELMEALGVDAVAVARVDVDLGGFTIMGFGPRYPQSRVNFIVYRRGQEKPVWHDGWIEGEEMDQSIGSTRFFDDDLLSELAVQSAKTAFAKIGAEKTN